MKGSPRSLALSAAHRAAGWWMGHAALALRRSQAAFLAALRKPAPKRRARRRRKG